MDVRACVGCAVVGAAAAAAIGDPVLLYQNDFESGSVGPEWSANTHLETAPAFTTFAGRYAGNDGIVLTLPAVQLPLGDGAVPPLDDGHVGGDGGDGDGGDPPVDPYLEYTVVFDIHAIDSWDGSSAVYGPDAFRVVTNGAIVFEETIANQHTNQTMREPDVGRAQLGYNIYDDSIYRQVGVTFTVPAEDEQIAIKFRGVGLQSITDEAWGIDNVHVYYELVPTPGAAAILGVGVLVIAGRRRR
jgi:hypothetical protein